jgi:hypothetical protein
MRREDVFPSKYLKPEDLNGHAMIATITRVTLETLKSRDGTEQKKAVLHFKETGKIFPLNATNFDATAAICGDDTVDWPGHKIELYPTKTPMGGKLVPCIRIRQPSVPDERPPDGDFSDDIPF